VVAASFLNCGAIADSATFTGNLLLEEGITITQH